MPNNDELMEYSFLDHKYYLTRYGYENASGEQLTNYLATADIDGFLKRVSIVVYSYIYSWAQDVNRTEYELSLEKHRRAIYNTLVEMTSTLLVNKTDLSLFYTKEPTDVVSPGVKMMLLNNGLCKRSKYPYVDYESLRAAGEY